MFLSASEALRADEEAGEGAGAKAHSRTGVRGRHAAPIS